MGNSRNLTPELRVEILKCAIDIVRKPGSSIEMDYEEVLDVCKKLDGYVRPSEDKWDEVEKAFGRFILETIVGEGTRCFDVETWHARYKKSLKIG